MRHPYPVFLDLADRPCLVVGGGGVAEGKVRGLLAAGARVTVVSPTLTPPLAAWARAGAIRHRVGEYRRGDLEGQQLVFVATGDPAVCDVVALDGRQGGTWVNAADDPGRCDFILPSVLRRGRLAVAVSTGGASPGLARAIRERLEAQFPADDGLLVELVAEVRRELRARGRAPAPEAWRCALDPELRRLIAGSCRDEARAWLEARLGAGA